MNETKLGMGSRQGDHAVSGERKQRAVASNRIASMNTMSYNGYTALIKYDERDNIFEGRILGIRTIISFHGETVTQLRAEFEIAVTDYLANCKEQGLQPDKVDPLRLQALDELAAQAQALKMGYD